MIKEITEELAEILGLLCAEGSHIIAFSSYWEKNNGKDYFRKNKKSVKIEFYNKYQKLLHHYQDLLEKEFTYKTKITKHGKVNIGNRRIIKNIIEFTKLGHMNWRVPEEVQVGNNKIKFKFLRGYFDGDGTASGCVRFFSSNPVGLKQVSKLLDDLSFGHYFYGPYLEERRKPSYALQIKRNLETDFLGHINPISKKKPFKEKNL